MSLQMNVKPYPHSAQHNTRTVFAGEQQGFYVPWYNKTINTIFAAEESGLQPLFQKFSNSCSSASASKSSGISSLAQQTTSNPVDTNREQTAQFLPGVCLDCVCMQIIVFCTSRRNQSSTDRIFPKITK